MSQVVVDAQAVELEAGVQESLVVCKTCGHLVPKTMMCLYCGSPILFRKPQG